VTTRNEQELSHPELKRVHQMLLKWNRVVGFNVLCFIVSIIQPFLVACAVE